MQEPAPKPNNRFSFRLYICGNTPASERALQNVRNVLSIVDYDLEVIDVLERPDIAESAGIVATPTLVREEPEPRESVVGDLSDVTAARTALGILRR